MALMPANATKEITRKRKNRPINNSIITCALCVCIYFVKRFLERIAKKTSKKNWRVCTFWPLGTPPPPPKKKETEKIEEASIGVCRAHQVIILRKGKLFFFVTVSYQKRMSCSAIVHARDARPAAVHFLFHKLLTSMEPIYSFRIFADGFVFFSFLF